jgi:hypothetical protein
MVQEKEHLRYAAYFLVALAALIAGLLLGQLVGPPDRGSRADWPKSSEPRPREIMP